MLCQQRWVQPFTRTVGRLIDQAGIIDAKSAKSKGKNHVDPTANSLNKRIPELAELRAYGRELDGFLQRFTPLKPVPTKHRSPSTEPSSARTRRVEPPTRLLRRDPRPHQAFRPASGRLSRPAGARGRVLRTARPQRRGQDDNVENGGRPSPPRLRLDLHSRCRCARRSGRRQARDGVAFGRADDLRQAHAGRISRFRCRPVGH